MGIISKFNSIIKPKPDEKLKCRPFVDLGDTSKMVKNGLSKNRCPKWMEVSPGVNFYGRCTNPSCEAHNKSVRCRWGFGTFILEQDLPEVKCPVCSEALEDVQTCGFIGTYWRYEGIKSEASKPVSSDWRKANLKYNSKFVLGNEGKGVKGELTHWTSLKIETISPEKYNEENKLSKIFMRGFKLQILASIF